MLREIKLPVHVNLRLSKAQGHAVDEWRRVQPDIPTRSEAIRRLTSLGIGGEPILRDILALMERLPHDGDLDRHIANVREVLNLPPAEGRADERSAGRPPGYEGV